MKRLYKCPGSFPPNRAADVFHLAVSLRADVKPLQTGRSLRRQTPAVGWRALLPRQATVKMRETGAERSGDQPAASAGSARFGCTSARLRQILTADGERKRGKKITQNGRRQRLEHALVLLPILDINDWIGAFGVRRWRN